MDNNENSINDKGNLKLRVIIAGVVILIALFVVWLVASSGADTSTAERGNEAVAQSQAEAQEAARQKEEAIQKQTEPLRKQLKGINAQKETISGEERFNTENCAKETASCGLYVPVIAQDRARLEELVTKYNDEAASLGKATLDASKPPLPSKLDKNGDPIPQ